MQLQIMNIIKRFERKKIQNFEKKQRMYVFDIKCFAQILMK